MRAHTHTHLSSDSADVGAKCISEQVEALTRFSVGDLQQPHFGDVQNLHGQGAALSWACLFSRVRLQFSKMVVTLTVSLVIPLVVFVAVPASTTHEARSLNKHI